jgi:pyruvate formate lyase activating enzyme
LHFSRFFPTYQLENLIPTPEQILINAYEIAKKQALKFVYLGNVELLDAGTTFCPDGKIGIKRQGFFITENNLTEGKCPDGETIPGVWK